MKPLDALCPPVLSCAETRELEAALFGGDEVREWAAMQRAGKAVAEALLHDFEEIGGFPRNGRVLVLAGKGHNAGDALIAAQLILRQYPKAVADVIFTLGARSLRPLASRAWREFAHEARIRVRTIGPEDLDSEGYALALDGVFGFQFRPPMPPEVARLFSALEKLPVALRAAVDLPSGLSEENAGLPIRFSSSGIQGGNAFKADFTYATGVVKAPVLAAGADWVGRLRYLDLGFFAESTRKGSLRVLTSKVLDPLRSFRRAESDKRDYGHVMVLGGSRSYPGAVFMAVRAALRAGAGLVTAFVPESLAPAYAARAPEAMWVGWPETPSGGLALEGAHLLRERIERANALVIGPGLAREPETLALVKDIVSTTTLPRVLDADALQPDIVAAGSGPRVLTPHAGEFHRIMRDREGDLVPTPETVVVLKGRLTMISTFDRVTYVSPFGGPVLARGGSGDLLAGMVGAQVAQTPDDPLLAAARGVVWHGLAADHLARAKGQVAVETTQLLDFLPIALRDNGERCR